MKNFLFAFAIFLVAVSCSKKVAQDDSNIALIHENDVSMNRAIEFAQSTLPLFLERFKNPVVGDSSFSVKVKVTDSAGVEHLWVNGLVVSDSGFSGIVGNEPEFVTSVQFNGPIEFVAKNISDWAYVDSNGVRQGSYTVKVLLNRMKSEDAKEYRDMFGWDDTVGNGFLSDSVK